MNLTEKEIAEGWVVHEQGPCPDIGMKSVLVKTDMGRIQNISDTNLPWCWDVPEGDGAERIIAYKIFDNSKKEDSTVDNVNSPSHYTKGGVECIEAIEASLDEVGFRAHLKGNVIKYMWRYESKAKPLEDLKKAQWYLNKLISKLENDGKNR